MAHSGHAGPSVKWMKEMFNVHNMDGKPSKSTKNGVKRGMSKKFCGLSLVVFSIAACVLTVRHFTSETVGVPLASLSVAEIDKYAIQAGLDTLALLDLRKKSGDNSQIFAEGVIKLAERESKKRAYVKARARDALKRRGVTVWAAIAAPSLEQLPYAIVFGVPTSVPSVSYSEARFRLFAGLAPTDEFVIDENGDVVRVKKPATTRSRRLEESRHE